MTLARFVRRVVAPVLFGIALIPVLGSLGLLRRTLQVDPSGIQHSSGLAYSFKTPESGFLLGLRSDRVEDPEASRLSLLLDGKPVGKAHSLHDEIAKNGRGAYSHWQDHVLFSMPDGSDPRASGSRLSFRYAIHGMPLAWLVSLLCVYLGLRALCFGEDRWQRLKGTEAWGRVVRRVVGWGALGGALTLAHAQAGPGERWALFTLGCVVCVLALRRLGASEPSSEVSPNLTFGIAMGAAAGSLVSSGIALAALSTFFNTDLPFYFTRPSEMFSTRPGEFSATTPLFGLILGFVQAVGLKGSALIGLQIVVRAWAVFAATRLGAARSPVFGCLLGLLLGLDPVAASLSTMYATESLHSSSLILAAVAISNLGSAPGWLRPLAVGVGVGLAGLFRPSGLALLGLAVVFLAWKARANQAFRTALAGIVIAVLMVSSVARLQRGSWQLVGGGGGLAFAWPLLVHQLLDPTNGPDSAVLAVAIDECDPQRRSGPIRLSDSNIRILTIKTCMVASGRTLEAVFQLFSSAYREAIRAHPERFALAIRNEFLNYLATTVAHNVVLGAQFVELEDLDALCRPNEAHPLFTRLPALKMGEGSERVKDVVAFVCPVPRPESRLKDLPRRATSLFRVIFQPYLYVLEPPFFRRSIGDVEQPYWMGLCAVSFGGLVLGISGGRLRRMGLVSVALLGTAAATVALTHLTVVRYLAPYSPWFLALSALLAFAFARDAANSVLDLIGAFRLRAPAGQEGPDPEWKPLWQAKPVSLAADLRGLKELLTSRRHLLLELTRREILDRHAGQLFGAGWAFLHPLLVVAVYVFVFGYVFKGRVGGGATAGLDYPAFLLAGLIPWLGFQESMARASVVIVGNANLVKQVIFPIEVLPVRVALAAFFTEAVLLIGLLMYVGFRGGIAPGTLVLLPAFLALQLLAFVGLNYFLAAFGVFFRDTRELVQAFAVMGLYLLPTIYSPDTAPSWLLSLLALNPFSHFVWCAQDALFFGHFQHPWSWLVATSFSLLLLLSGYRFFRRASIVFGNLL